MRSRTWDYIALTIAILGAINWGLIGLFRLDLIAVMFGGVDSVVSRIIYILYALAGLYLISFFGRNYNESVHAVDR